MNVLVTGGAGYAGYSLVRSLAQRDDVERIVVTDNLGRSNYGLFINGSHGPAPVVFRRVDILDGYGLDEVLDGVDTVFHLAAYATTSFTDQQTHSFDQVNHWGTSQLARSIEKTDRVDKIVYLSTFAVYGSHDEPVDEDTLPKPTNAYGISKLQGEAQLERLSRDRDVWIVRAANVFGASPTMRLDTMINNMAFDAWTEGRIRVDGDGTQTRPIIEVDTLGRVLSEVPTSTAPPGIYNLAAYNVSVLEIAELLSAHVPNLDLMYVSRDVRMRRISLQLPVKLDKFVAVQPPKLADAVAKLIDNLAGVTTAST